MDRKLSLGVLLLALSIGNSFAIPAPSRFSDYNGDGKSDLAVYNESAGLWFVGNADTNNSIVPNVPWGFNGATALLGDYDGDTNADLAVYARASGLWYVRSYPGSVLVWNKQWGFNGAVPVHGDYDYDGGADTNKSDFAVFHPPTGRWYIQSAAGGVLAWNVQWGFPTAIPVPGDYNADAKSDLAVYDRNTGRWYIRDLANGSNILWNFQWGFQGAVPVSGDFDGDGVNDLAVYHPATAKWYIKNSGGSVVWDKTFGTPNTGIPMAGDYDGDNDFDLAAYTSTVGVWNCRDAGSNTNLPGLSNRQAGNASSRPVGAPEVAMHLPILTGGEGFLFKSSTTLVLLPSRYSGKVARVVFANDPSGRDVFFNLYYTGKFGGRLKYRWTELKGQLGGKSFYVVVFPKDGGLPQPYRIFDGGRRQE